MALITDLPHECEMMHLISLICIFRAVRVNDTLVLRCFPQLLLIGCERCATGGMFSRLTLHRHILYPFLGNRALKDPLFFNGVVGMYVCFFTVLV